MTIIFTLIFILIFHYRTFIAKKTENPPECGPPFIKASAGVLRSPGYPTHYRESLHCVWTIHTESPFEVLEFEFLDMELERSEDCAYDYVSFHALSLNQREQTLLGRFCGDILPEKFTSPTSSVKVIFNSDITNIRRGFVLRWSRGKRLNSCPSATSENRQSECTNENYVGSICSHHCQTGFKLYGDIHSTCISHKQDKARWSPVLPKCMAAEYSNLCGNQVLESPSGTLRSPQSPVPYSVPIQCTWTIAVDSEFEVLDFEFMQMKIPESDSCALAYVEFYSISPINHQKTLDGRFCGNHWPNVFSSTSTNVKIVFNSHVDETKGGFAVRWWRAKRSVGCLEISFGNGKAKCTNGNQVGSVCTFTCNSDRSMVGDAESTCIATEIGGARWSPPFPECTTEIKANDCGREVLKSSHGSLTSPVYNTQQSIHVYCTWYIEAERKVQVLEFEFKTIDLRNTPNCAYDYVEFRSLLDSRSDEYLIGRFCGKILPANFTSYTSKVKVTFSSFVNARGGGFRVLWKPGNVTIFCPALVQIPGLRSFCTARNQLGSKCNHTCSNGLSVVGSSTTTCIKTVLNDARWSPQPPSCSNGLARQFEDRFADASSCPLPVIANGLNACPEGIGPNSVCRFSCSFGYEVNGSVISTCSQFKNGLRWEPKIPSCIISPTAVTLIIALAIAVALLLLCLSCSVCCSVSRLQKTSVYLLRPKTRSFQAKYKEKNAKKEKTATPTIDKAQTA